MRASSSPTRQAEHWGELRQTLLDALERPRDVRRRLRQQQPAVLVGDDDVGERPAGVDGDAKPHQSVAFTRSELFQWSCRPASDGLRAIIGQDPVPMQPHADDPVRLGDNPAVAVIETSNWQALADRALTDERHRSRSRNAHCERKGAGMAPSVDLNADMGESYGRWTLGDDAALMGFLTSANIACGFHGGDPHVMRSTVALAVEHGVGVGAHVSFPDLIGFGRRRLAATAEEVQDYVVYQAGAIRAFVEAAGGRLQHVKPHGALYA